MSFDPIRPTSWAPESPVTHDEMELIDTYLESSLDIRETKTNTIDSVNTFTHQTNLTNAVITKASVSTSLTVDGTLYVNSDLTLTEDLTLSAFPSLTNIADSVNVPASHLHLIKADKTNSKVIDVVDSTTQATRCSYTTLIGDPSATEYFHFAIDKAYLYRGGVISYAHVYFEPLTGSGVGSATDIDTTISACLYRINGCVNGGNLNSSAEALGTEVYYTTYASWAGAIRYLTFTIPAGPEGIISSNYEYQLRIKLGPQALYLKVALTGLQLTYSSIPTLRNF